MGIPILTFVGAAIGTISSSDIQTKAKAYFTALYTTEEAIVSPDSIKATHKSASQISIFNSIGTSLSKLRISK